jgi:hypothetical protein
MSVVAVLLPIAAVAVFVCGTPTEALASGDYCYYGGQYSIGACVNTACPTDPHIQECEWDTQGNAQWGQCGTCTNPIAR